MKNPAVKFFLDRIKKLSHAFQPIVNIHTGKAFAFEALLRGYDEAGFSSIDSVFDEAFDLGILHQADLFLRQKAFEKFAEFKGNKNIKLFYNLDNRLFDSKNYSYGETLKILQKLGYRQEEICFEISERHQLNYNNNTAKKLLNHYRKQGYKIAIDDYGTGFSGLQLLYYIEPDYIKIDRFFIRNMSEDPKKRLLVSTLVNLARIMGCLILAEGVETRAEHSLCKEIGCDMVQGYYIQHPDQEISKLCTQYKKIHNINQREKRKDLIKDKTLISNAVDFVEPVKYSDDIITVCNRFQKNKSQNFFPVVNERQEPLGILRDTSFKEFLFSRFGRAILENPVYRKNIQRFIHQIPVSDVHSHIEKIIELYTQHNNNEGVIMVEDMKYKGILSTKSLLKVINEKNITQARNQNPLSRLPGNNMIHEYFSESLAKPNNNYHLIYFDFDNFKPFNDTYGFRNGDRLILAFADLLKKAGKTENRFIGHVGGDDFFMGVRDETTENLINEMSMLAGQFKKSASSFYDKKTIEKGFMKVLDRNGVKQKIPLITVSTAILELPKGHACNCTIEDAGNYISQLKKKAKIARSGIASATIEYFLVPMDNKSNYHKSEHKEIIADLIG